MYALVVISLETLEHRQETGVPIFVDKYKKFFNNFFHFCYNNGCFQTVKKKRNIYLL